MQVLDDGDGALTTHRAAYVQLAVLPEGEIYLRVGHIAPDVALVVGHGQYGAQRAAALDLKGQAGAAVLQGIAHETGGGKRAAQRRRAYRQKLVNLPCPFRQVAAADGGGLYQTVG